MSGKSSSSTSHQTTSQQFDQRIVADGEGNITSSSGGVVNIDNTSPELLEMTQGIVQDHVDLTGDAIGQAGESIMEMIDGIKTVLTESQTQSSTIAEKSLELAGRAETNDGLQTFLDIMKVGLPVLAIILVAYFWSKKK